MDNFARCLAFTLEAEGGYSDNLADPGKWTSGKPGTGKLQGTKFGISAAAYPDLDIANLTEEMAALIYRRDFWVPLQGDVLPLLVAFAAFDAAVNAGVRRSILWMQQAAEVKDDGVLGPETIAAINSGDALHIAREALVRRIDFYARLPGWADFGLGWSRRIIALAGELTA